MRWLNQGMMDLPRAWGLISAGPAQIMRMTDRGEIAPGKRADLTIVNKATRVVERRWWRGGSPIWRRGGAERFMGLPRTVSMAAE